MVYCSVILLVACGYYMSLCVVLSIYGIYLIKRPGVYFRSKSLEGAFKRGGRLKRRAFIVMSTPKLLHSSSYCALLGNLFLSLNLSHRSALCVGISLSLPSMHHKKYYYSMLPCLQLDSMCYFSSTHSATPHIWAII